MQFKLDSAPTRCTELLRQVTANEYLHQSAQREGERGRVSTTTERSNEHAQGGDLTPGTAHGERDCWG